MNSKRTRSRSEMALNLQQGLGKHPALRWVLRRYRPNGDRRQPAYVALLWDVVLVIALGFGGSGVAMAQTPAPGGVPS